MKKILSIRKMCCIIGMYFFLQGFYMEYGYKKKPKFIVIFSFFYLLYPIINIVAFLSTTPPSVALSTFQDFILEKPTYMLLNIALWLATLPLCYGLFKVKRWAWFYFVVHAILVITMSLFSVVSIKEDIDVQPRFNIVFFLNLLVLIPMILFTKKEIRMPYLNPRLKWWEQSKRVKHNVKVVFQNEDFDTFDISESGAFILDTENKIKVYPEDIIPISLALDNKIIKCYCEVIWINQGNRENLPNGMGIRFINLKKEEILEIKKFISTIHSESRNVYK